MGRGFDYALWILIQNFMRNRGQDSQAYKDLSVNFMLRLFLSILIGYSKFSLNQIA